MKLTNAECTVQNSWWWAKKMPETCRVLWQNKFWVISASGWLLKKKPVRTHGKMNVNMRRNTSSWWRKCNFECVECLRSVMSIKNSYDTIRNRTRDLSACSSVHPVPSHFHGTSVNLISLNTIRTSRSSLHRYSQKCQSLHTHLWPCPF